MMKKRVLFLMFAAVSAAGMTGGAASPALQQVVPNDDWCRRERWGNDRETYCEVRQYVISGGASVLAVDASPNGGIDVEGTGRGDVQVLAKVQANAATEQRAREIASAVRIEATPSRIGADGPTGLDRREGWSVSYRLSVPNMSSLSLQTVNGGITIRDVEGQIDFKTVNGGVKLAGLAGNVKGRTSNGGVDVDLDGVSWRGEGLDVETSNGGVKLVIPEQYSAHLESGTINGGVNVDFPVTVRGRMDREIVADIGGGGPPIRVRTHNGGIKIMKK
jgi:hypothetical protein